MGLEWKKSVESFECDHGFGEQITHEREDVPTVTQPYGFRENYLAGNVAHVHCKWWPWVRPLDVKHLCLRFQWLFDCDKRMTEEAVLRVGRPFDSCPILYDQNGAVFIDVVEALENPQLVSVGLVWLRLLDCCEHLGSQDEFKEGLAVRPLLGDAPIRPETVRILADRKTGVLDLFVRQYSGLPSIGGDRADDMIERGPRLVNDVSYKYPQLNLLRWMQGIGADTYVVPIRLQMQGDTMRGVYRASLPQECGFEVFQVFFGSLKFQPYKVQSVHHGQEAPTSAQHNH